MNALELRDLHKRFGSVIALDGLDLTVREGEFFVILGPSASGKTTTLRSIAGVERVDRGTIAVNGEDLTEAPIQGRDVAMVFQSFALYPHLKIRDNLAYPLREQGLGRREIAEKVEQVASMLRLTHTLNRLPTTASGGEQQRIAIGRALIREPSLLLLDEPLTNLDAKLRHDTRAEFKRLHRVLGMTMVYATPDELEALSMGERIAVLRDGKVVQVGTPDELYEAPDHSFVATLVGSPKMNLVPAQRLGEAQIKTAFAGIQTGPWTEALTQNRDTQRFHFGIRPHDLRPAISNSDGLQFHASVHLTEPLGDVTVIDLLAQGVPLRMVLPEEEAVSMREGDDLNISMRVDQSHLFDLDTGRAIR